MSSRPPPIPGKLPPPSTPPPRGSSAPPPGSSAPPAKPKEQAPAGPTPAQRAARNAAYSLAAFTFVVIGTLIAWFVSADQPWGFASFIAVLTALFGIGTTLLLWRQPTREHAIAGLVVMGVSLLRVGLPVTWSWPSVVVLTITVLFAIPLVQAVIVLPRT